MDLSGFGKTIPSGLTDSNLRVNEDAFLPGRNLLFVLAGAAHAVTVRANSVAIGLLNPADHLFPDQTEEFVAECERMIEMAMGRRIVVLMPLIEFSKRDVMVMARVRGIEHPYSCHSGGDEPCGVCIACDEISNAKNENSNIEFNDWSLKKPFNSEEANYIKRGIRERIRQSSTTIVYLSNNTAGSEWVNWEIQESVAMGKGVVGMHKGNSPPRRLPKAIADNKIPVVPWNQEQLARAIENEQSR